MRTRPFEGRAADRPASPSRPSPPSPARSISSAFLARATLLLVIFGGATHVSGLPTTDLVTQLVHRSWDAELPQQSVQALAQTPDGLIWIGTQAGLARFDGSRFEVVARWEVRSLAVAPDGLLWIGTGDRGLWSLDGGRPRPRVDSSSGLASDTVTALATAEDEVWAGTPAGLSRVRGERVVSISPTDRGRPGSRVRVEVPDAELDVRALLVDGDTLWVGSAVGLSRIDRSAPENVRTLVTDDGLPSSSVWSLALCDDGLLVGTKGGPALVAGEQIVPVVGAEELAGREITRVVARQNGESWFTVNAGGVFRLRPGRGLDPVETRTSLRSPIVWALMESADRGVWIGSLRGLDALFAGPARTVSASEGLGAEYATAVLPGSAGGLWVGTAGAGLTHFAAGGRSRRFAPEDGLAHPVVVSLAEAAGRLWVGTAGGGLQSIGPRDGISAPTTTGDGLPSDIVIGIEPDTSAPAEAPRLWIATPNGLARIALDDGAVEAWTVDDGLPHRQVQVLLDEPDGLRIGTAGGLALRERDGRIRDIELPHELGADVLALHRTPGGELWVGTARGMGRARDGTFERIPLPAPFEETTIYSILSDEDGGIWVSTPLGIVGVDPRSEAGTPGFLVHVGASDGMRNPEATGGNQPAGARTSDGALWFTTLDGVVRLDPGAVGTGDLPPVRVDEVLVNGTPVDPRTEFEIPAGRSRLEVRTTVPSFRAPERLRFRHRLSGQDDSWVDAGTRRRLEYTNLEPGSHVLEIAAHDTQGPEARPARLVFVQTPRLRERLWFQSLVVALVGLVAFGGFRWRIAQLERRHAQEKARALEELDHRRKTEELEKARAVQISMLPEGSFESDELEVVAQMRTAAEVGGDYYDWFVSGDEGMLWVVVGDATGHGVASGLLVGMVKMALVSGLPEVSSDDDVEALLGRLNSGLREAVTQKSLGMSLLLARLEVATGRARIWSLGMPRPLVYRRDADELEELPIAAPPLGFLRRVRLASAELRLEDGDLLVLLSDGIYERPGSSGESWGTERLAAATVAAARDARKPREVVDDLFAASDAFADDAEPPDDLSVVVVSRRTVGRSPSPDRARYPREKPGPGAPA